MKGLGTQATRPRSCAGGLPIWRPICGGAAHAYRQTQAQTERLPNQLLAKTHHTPAQAAGHEAETKITKKREYLHTVSTEKTYLCDYCAAQISQKTT